MKQSLTLKLFLAFAFIFSSSFTFAADLPRVRGNDPLPANLFVELAKVVNPAVVNIYTTYLPKGRIDRFRGQDPFFDLFEQFMGPRGGMPYGGGRPAQSLGTGFIIREDGLIVTNNHVIDKADVIKVQLEEKSKESFDAKVIGTDPTTDIALIKIETKRKLPVLKMGSSSDLQVGEWVAAFGNPYGHGHSMTKGIISAIGRSIDELNLFPFIQTDASINPGNSGGPLVNTQGQVIGVNTAIDARAQGIGFAIPIDNVTSILNQLEKTGTVARGYIGVGMGEIDPESAESLGLRDSSGALIVQVFPQSPAEKAGIEAYDLITEFNNIKIESAGSLMKAVKSTPVGKTVPVKLVRNLKGKTVNLTVGSQDAENTARSKPPASKKFEGVKMPFDIGFVASNYNPAMSEQYGIPRLRQPHPVVTGVERDSEAARSGLSPGDVILDVNRTPTVKANDIVRALKKGSVNIFRVLKQDRVVLISVRVR